MSIWLLHALYAATLLPGSAAYRSDQRSKAVLEIQSKGFATHGHQDIHDQGHQEGEHAAHGNQSQGKPRFFLTKGEIKEVRNGEPRPYISLHSAKNSVRYLPNGDKFMARLFDVLSATKRGDFIYGTFFNLVLDVMLKPNPRDKVASGKSKLITVLSAAAKRGVEIKLLLTYGLFTYLTAHKICDRVDDACGKKGTCIPDMRHGYQYRGSNHMKAWMVRRGDALTAFTGSMDIANARWDTAEHDTTSPEWQMQPGDFRQFGWRGTMYEIVGVAAEDILVTFWQRWNDPAPPWHHWNETAADRLPTFQLWLPSWQKDFPGYQGDLNVQVVRTFSCTGAQSDKLYQHFAPSGEFSYAAAWYKALRKAKNYIVVADQFMWFEEALKAVVVAAHRVKFVIILTNTGDTGMKIPGTDVDLGFPADDRDFLSLAVQHYQHQALAKVLKKDGVLSTIAKKVHVFKLVKEGKCVQSKYYQTSQSCDEKHQIYNHEKTLLIDDKYALVGSTGVEQAGFTNDVDLSIAVESKRFATDLRRQMFGEFLLRDPSHSTLRTPQSTLRECLRQANNGALRLRHHMPVSTNYLKLPIAATFYYFFEPDGRCYDDDHAKQWAAALSAGKR